MKRLVSISIFLVLAIIVLWSITSDYSTTEELLDTESRQYAEIFMNEFEMTAMDENGKPDYILNGTRLQRNKHSDVTEIRLPVLQLMQENGQWKVSADKAFLNDDNETVRLINNVVMQQQNIEPAMTIRTQNLSINAALKTARTKADVDITQGKSRLQSRGMIYNNITNELKLLSNVNGYYLPQD